MQMMLSSNFSALTSEEEQLVNGGAKASTIGWWATGALLGAAVGIASVLTAPITLPAMAVSVAVGAAVGTAHLGIVSGIVSSSLQFAGK